MQHWQLSAVLMRKISGWIISLSLFLVSAVLMLYYHICRFLTVNETHLSIHYDQCIFNASRRVYISVGNVHVSYVEEWVWPLDCIKYPWVTSLKFCIFRIIYEYLNIICSYTRYYCNNLLCVNNGRRMDKIAEMRNMIKLAISVKV